MLTDTAPTVSPGIGCLRLPGDDVDFGAAGADL